MTLMASHEWYHFVQWVMSNQGYWAYGAMTFLRYNNFPKKEWYTKEGTLLSLEKIIDRNGGMEGKRAKTLPSLEDMDKLTFKPMSITSLVDNEVHQKIERKQQDWLTLSETTKVEHWVWEDGLESNIGYMPYVPLNFPKDQKIHDYWLEQETHIVKSVSRNLGIQY